VSQLVCTIVNVAQTLYLRLLHTHGPSPQKSAYLPSIPAKYLHFSLTPDCYKSCVTDNFGACYRTKNTQDVYIFDLYRYSYFIVKKSYKKLDKFKYGVTMCNKR